MKTKKIIVSIVITLIIVLSTVLSVSGPHPDLPEIVKEPDPPPPLEDLIPEGIRTDNKMILRVLFNEEIKEMTAERYLIGATAAEMPASFEPGALMAQAIALRTNTLYNMQIRSKTNHPDADVCTDFSCCSAYIDDETLREKWSADYILNITKVIDAIISTDGEYIEYDGKPIQALFHSSSAGMTETSGNVWIEDLPYLQSVYSPETAENVPDYVSTRTVSLTDFIETIRKDYPNAVFSGDSNTWITDTTYTVSGRVNTQIIGGVLIRGTKLRSMFNLRSTDISFEFIEENIVFTTVGFGHGVGMSQYGANVMAKDGMDCYDILMTYYKGVNVSRGSKVNGSLVLSEG